LSKEQNSAREMLALEVNPVWIDGNRVEALDGLMM
jgi:hypothetical protein